MEENKRIEKLEQTVQLLQQQVQLLREELSNFKNSFGFESCNDDHTCDNELECTQCKSNDAEPVSAVYNNIKLV